MKSSDVSPARLVAFEILQRVAQGAYASVLLASKEGRLSSPDRALCHELVMGVLRRQLWLDRLIEYYSRRKIEGLDLPVLLILRLGLYQLRFLSRVPASAVVNESVNLASRARIRSAGGLVNAVLRRAIREPDVDPVAGIADPIEKLAVATSHPPWLIERWIKAFGAEQAEAFASANNNPAPLAFRVVKHTAEESEVIESLHRTGFEPTPSRIVRHAWRAGGAGKVLASLAAKGQIYIQDEASQLAAEVLDAQPGHRVLDLCSAPGGKATQIADRRGNSCLVVAGDLHEHRLRTLEFSTKLHGLPNIQGIALDGLRSLPFADDSFDAVLVDAPCSGTGTLRRNPEIRWRITAGDIRDLSDRQGLLLSNAARVVKGGGRLVYSTCSVETDENEGVRQKFLEKYKNFQPAELRVNPTLKTSFDRARTWPHRDGTDGFFICAFERKS